MIARKLHQLAMLLARASTRFHNWSVTEQTQLHGVERGWFGSLFFFLAVAFVFHVQWLGYLCVGLAGVSLGAIVFLALLPLLIP